jgi:hypothetical protein
MLLCDNHVLWDAPANATGITERLLLLAPHVPFSRVPKFKFALRTRNHMFGVQLCTSYAHSTAFGNDGWMPVVLKAR